MITDVLSLDGETTGLPTKGMQLDDPDYPRLKQIGLVQFESGGKIYGREEHLVRVDAYSSKGAERVHGITDREAGRRGISELLTLFLIYEATNIAQVVTGWNVNFDIDVVKATAIRLGRDPMKVIRPGCMIVDLQQVMTPLVGKTFDDGGLSWPNLEEGYRWLFGREMKNHHNAFDDALACRSIFLELSSRGLIPDVQSKDAA